MVKCSDEYLPLQPLGARVLIERAPAERQTAGGIVIPERAAERPQKGRVLAVGPEVPENVPPGAVVLFGRHSGVDVELGGVEYVVMLADDVLCLVRDE